MVAETGISFYRKRKGLTQLALGNELGIDDGTMARIENGHHIPTAPQVDKLVEVLEVPPSYLFSKHILAEVAERARSAEAAT